MFIEVTSPSFYLHPNVYPAKKHYVNVQHIVRIEVGTENDRKYNYNTTIYLSKGDSLNVMETYEIVKALIDNETNTGNGVLPSSGN